MGCLLTDPCCHGITEWVWLCCPQNQICYLLCNNSIITHSEETLIIYVRVAQAWMLSGIPQIKHTHQTLHAVICTQKFRFRSFPSAAPLLGLVTEFHTSHTTPAQFYTCSGEGYSAGHRVFLTCRCDF